MQVIGGSPVMVYLLGAALIVHLVIKLYPSAFGSLGRHLDERAARKRQAAVERDDADIAELQRQTRYLLKRSAAMGALIAELREGQRQHDLFLAAHARWDRHMIASLIAADPTVDIPDLPPLWPPTSIPSMKGNAKP